MLVMKVISDYWSESHNMNHHAFNMCSTLGIQLATTNMQAKFNSKLIALWLLISFYMQLTVKYVIIKMMSAFYPCPWRQWCTSYVRSIGKYFLVWACVRVDRRPAAGVISILLTISNHVISKYGFIYYDQSTLIQQFTVVIVVKVLLNIQKRSNYWFSWLKKMLSFAIWNYGNPNMHISKF